MRHLLAGLLFLCGCSDSATSAIVDITADSNATDVPVCVRIVWSGVDTETKRHCSPENITVVDGSFKSTFAATPDDLAAEFDRLNEVFLRFGSDEEAGDVSFANEEYADDVVTLKISVTFEL